MNDPITLFGLTFLLLAAGRFVMSMRQRQPQVTAFARITKIQRHTH